MNNITNKSDEIWTLNKDDSERTNRVNWLNFYILPPVCTLGFLIELAAAITFYQINNNNNNQNRHRRQSSGLIGKFLNVNRRHININYRNKRRIKIYEYLFLYSLSEMLILVINIVFGVFNCGPYCNVDAYVSRHVIEQFERYAKVFACNTLYTFNVLVEFKIACDRYEKLTDLKHLVSSTRKAAAATTATTTSPPKNLTYKTTVGVCNRYLSSPSSVGPLLMALSLVINTPYIFIYNAIDHESNMLAPDLLVASGHPPMWLKLLAVAYFLKDFLGLVFVCGFNFMVLLALRAVRVNSSTSTSVTHSPVSSTAEVNGNDRATTRSGFGRLYERKENRVAQMVVFLSVLFLIGHLPETFYRIKRKLNILFFTTQINYLSYYLVVANCVSFVSAYANLFIYLYFSRTFKEQFKASFCPYCCSCCNRSQSNRRRSQVALPVHV